MFSTLVTKELKSILLSPKFATTFAVSAFLMLLSVLIGIKEYQAALDQYHAAGQLVQQEMREARQWMAVNNRVYREPDPIQIFVAGVQNDVGRFSSISSWEPVKLVHSAYSDDPIFAVFRFIDFAFIVQVVLTLLAVLFTYDAINGERENGTLQLTFSNSVPRAQYVFSKLVGSWLGLAIPLAIPVLLSIFLMFVFKIPMTATSWAKLAALIGASVLLFTFFVAFGVLVSALTRNSNVSFLVCLVSWVVFVLIVPRVAIMVAGQMMSVPTVAEVESQQDSFAKNQWNTHMKDMTERWRKRNESLQGLGEKERDAKRDEMEWAQAEEDQKSRKEMQNTIDENARKLKEGLRNRKMGQEKLAFALSRFSPVSAYQLAVMNLAATDVKLKTRYEDALNSFRTVFNQYKEKKQKESGNSGGLRISVDSQRGVKIDTGREMALDLSDMPQVQPVKVSFLEAFAPAIIDFGLLGAFTIFAFFGAFVAFLRYDVR
jgi:ABC-type transport system involved in multi-copper enzyme maturation permease subunit